ncbi:hypothetical protein [Ruficoccus sp. ZRK36]|uniref:hypothetical protein n=1 Tax=Ruficoccus sp. ZRK36 TaxID=2866311 RepID=UPI001C73D051|nr:hypothetical protein [Ruficoccus sp. ZRK36]QYY35054.1 hypothetical protein K0V07_12175 [Ruficoccus sp. ZRK36]
MKRLLPYFKTSLCALFFTPMLTCLAASPAAHTEEPSLPDLKISSDGTFAIDGVTFGLRYYAPSWKSVAQSALTVEGEALAPEIPLTQPFEVRGALDVGEGLPPVQVLEQIVPGASPDSIHVRLKAIPGGETPANQFSFEVALPVKAFAGRSISVDGQGYAMPIDQPSTPSLFSVPEGEHTVVLPLSDGLLSLKGNFALSAQDNRKWKLSEYVLRLRIPGAVKDNLLRETELELDVSYRPYQQQTVDISEAANRSFSDETPGDGEGGWTDQGKQNDLSVLPSGPLNVGALEFDILDPSSNDGLGAIVVGGPDREGFSREAELTLPSSDETEGWQSLYLLHAAAWLPRTGTVAVGTMTVHYEDGTEASLDVRSGRDVGDWWMTMPLPNGSVAWDSENPSSTVSLYASVFPIDPTRKPVSITFEGQGSTAWMIAAVSASHDRIPFEYASRPLTIAVGHHWARYEHQVEVKSGGVFDFSASVPAPAGQFGELIETPEGHFAFEKRPDVPVRFWGVNFCFTANYLNKSEADAVAQRLARSGYNAVRFHHFEQALTSKGANSWELDPELMDKLDYLVAAMKKAGLYISYDLFDGRSFSDEELVAFGLEPGLTGSQTRSMFKGLVPIDEAAFASWEKFARALMLHKNPYTGLTWAEDPVFVGVCVVNEDTLYAKIRNPKIHARYEAIFEAEYPGITDASEDERLMAWTEFLTETQINASARMFKALREMGVRAPLTDTNYIRQKFMTYLRVHYDYVDDHNYWDHPGFPGKAWKAPFAFNQRSAIQAAAQLPRLMMASRIPGKPFTVTEFNYCRPNQYRAEGGVLMSAYASLQDWDGLYNFQYAMSREMSVNGSHENYFALASDPISMLGDRVAALLFRRGDISPAATSITYAVRPEEGFISYNDGFPHVFTELGLVARLGSLPGSPEAVLQGADGRPVPDAAVVGEIPPLKDPSLVDTFVADTELPQQLIADGILPEGSINAERTRFASETDQIVLDTEASSIKVVTPRSEQFVVPPESTLKGECVSVTNTSETQCAVQVVAVDDQPLAQSRRILITHLTDALPEGMRFADQDRRLLEDWGTPQHLVRSGTAQITLKLPEPASWKAWAVDASGSRKYLVSLETSADGSLVIDASTVTKKGTQLAYELVR